MEAKQDDARLYAPGKRCNLSKVEIKSKNHSTLIDGLFESVGIETAFVTVPGHIFIGLSLDIDPEESEDHFTSIDDLIFKAGKTWLPVEVTKIEEGFLQAWQTGAKQWREHAIQNQAAILLLHECWEIYSPVGFKAPEEPI
ncbi:unnamed protein product [marine sediment metagenome]|uniref:Uncharacterized protein n=1 Tax=marine sediment metagenome TaxID=412755 RepID=X1CTM8_9ZZZZ